MNVSDKFCPQLHAVYAIRIEHTHTHTEWEISFDGRTHSPSEKPDLKVTSIFLSFISLIRSEASRALAKRTHAHSGYLI